MFAILHALGLFVVDLFKSRSRLEAENLFLRHQLNIALRRIPPRLRLFGSDRALVVSPAYVRFTPESGHVQCTRPCPLWANSGHAGISSRRGSAVMTR